MIVVFPAQCYTIDAVPDIVTINLHGLGIMHFQDFYRKAGMIDMGDKSPKKREKKKKATEKVKAISAISADSSSIPKPIKDIKK